MAANITISVDGIDEFNRTFTRMDAAFSDLTPIWPDLKKKFHELEAKQFSSEGSAGRDGRWPALSPSYAIQKIKRYGSGLKILQGTGDLMRSLTSDTGDSYYRTSKTDFVIGTTLPYAMYHQRGSGRLKRRPPINFSSDQQKELMKTIQVSLVKELRRGGGYQLPGDR